VVVDGAGAKLFRREALDLVMDEAKSPQNTPRASMQIAEPML
jgi:hypothetical protein